MHLGPYAGFIVAAYSAAVVVIGALVGWIIADHRIQTRTLDDLESRGMTRRSSSPREAA